MNSRKSIKKLQTKVFWIIWTILTVMIAAFAGLFIYQTHMREVRRMEDMRRAQVVGEFRPPKFEESMRENRISMIELLGIVVVFETAATFLAYVLMQYVTKPIAEAFTAQEQFVMDASHELKTPLAVIISSAEMLNEEIPRTQWLDNIQIEAQRMDKMVKELLQLATLADTENYNFAHGNLSQVVKNTALAFDSIAYERKIKLKTNIESNIVLEFDEQKARQLVEILLDNAIQHTTTQRCVELSLRKVKGKIQLVVRNQGKAILRGEEEKIFARFYRSDKAHGHQDNHYGLGLAIAQDIARVHDARITAESQDGWTEFVVNFSKR